MSKITLLGDSIRCYYSKKVIELLGDKHTYFQPEENCRFSKYTLRGIFDWREGLKDSDIIHWNNGLWDCTYCVDGIPFTDIDEYVKNMTRVAGLLLKRAKTVIFATTTPVRQAPTDYDKNNTIIQYNKVIVPILSDMGVKINDLHSVIYPDVDTYISDDMIHPNEKGVEVLAKQVVKAINQELSALKL